jgi:hypothetical protein
MAIHTCNPGLWEAEAGGSPVPGQPGLNHCVVEVVVLCQIGFVVIVSGSVASLFIILMIVCDEQKFLTLMKCDMFIAFRPVS